MLQKAQLTLNYRTVTGRLDTTVHAFGFSFLIVAIQKENIPKPTLRMKSVLARYMQGANTTTKATKSKRAREAGVTNTGRQCIVK